MSLSPPNQLLYKTNLQEALERLTAFWKRAMPDQILAVMSGNPIAVEDRVNWAAIRADAPPQGAPMEVPNPQEIFERVDKALSNRMGLEDDSMPVGYVTLDFGESLCGAMLGAEVKHFSDGCGGTYSWSQSLLNSWEALPRLRFDEDNYWARRVRETLEYCATRARGKFGLSPFMAIDALNLAAELRGATQVYYDLYDHPEQLRELMDFGVEYMIRFWEMQDRIIGSFAGGTFNYSGQWFPFPRPTVWLSVDVYLSCAPQVYHKMGMEYQQRLMDHFGQGLMHYHCTEVGLLREVMALHGLIGIEISESGRPQDPSPFEALPEIRKVTDDTPLQVACTKDELVRGMREQTLPGGVMYFVRGVETVNEGNGLMEEVRKYRAPF